MLNIHYFTDRQKPPKSESPHLSFFLQRAILAGHRPGEIWGSQSAAVYLHAIAFYGCAVVNKFLVGIAINILHFQYKSRQLLTLPRDSEKSLRRGIWYMVFMLLPYLTIQMFKAVWLFVLPLAFHHHPPPPPPGVTGLTFVPLMAVPAMLSA